MQQCKKNGFPRISILLLLAFCAALFAGSAAFAKDSATFFTFAQWADIHYGHAQTSEADWDWALADGITNGGQAFVFSGDATDNKEMTNEQFLALNERFLRNYAPIMLGEHKPVLLSYGNNDFYKNYCTDPENMKPIFALYKKYFGDKYYLDSVGNGVYGKEIGGMNWITINSVTFTQWNDYAGKEEQGKKTLDWLEMRLNALPKDKGVVIVSHVPPTYDLYDKKSSWEKNALKRFFEILDKSDRRIVILSGHYHRNEQHAYITEEGDAIPVIDVGGMSEKYGYHGNYRTQCWRMKNGIPDLLSWRLRYANHPEWNHVVYVNEPFAKSTWTSFREALRTNDRFFINYMTDFWPHGDISKADSERDAVVDEFIINTAI